MFMENISVNSYVNCNLSLKFVKIFCCENVHYTAFCFVLTLWLLLPFGTYV